MRDGWETAGSIEALGAERSGQLVSALGVALRALRRREAEDIVSMSRRIAPESAPETLAALERGDAAPEGDFLDRISAAYPLDEAERADLEEAVFLAADPFMTKIGVAPASREAALARLARPVDLGRDEALERARALLSPRSPRSLVARRE